LTVTLLNVFFITKHTKKKGYNNSLIKIIQMR
jgi:hypothetical protein